MKKTIISTLLSISITLSIWGSDRVTYVINDNWKFMLDDSELPSDVDWNSERSVYVDIPHTWNNLDITDDIPGYYRGAGWYKKVLDIPVSDENIYLLNFDAANQVVDLFINKKKAGTHIGGYTSFSFDITGFLNRNGEKNLIEIRVDNSHDENIPPLSADFNFFGGIYRDISIEVKSDVIFDRGAYNGKAVYWQTPDVTDDMAVLRLFGSVRNMDNVKKTVTVEHSLFNSEHVLVETIKKKFKLSKGELLRLEVDSFIINKPHLWSVEDPNLYSLESRIIDVKTNTILDEVSSKVGLRWFSFDGKNGFYLNGKHVKIIGTSRHQDFPNLGNAIPKSVNYSDVKKLKNMGGNFLRIAHYPQDQSVLDYCDEIGILCSVEIPIVNTITESDTFTNNTVQMLQEMIMQNYNHPSLIIWAYMNEVLLGPRFSDNPDRQKIYFQSIYKLAVKLEKIIRELDPYRYTMIPDHGNFDLYHETGLTKVPMIVGWNLYFGWYYDELDGFEKFLDKFHETLPETPVIITEYGAGNDPRLISDTPVRFDFTDEYALKYHSHYKKVIQEKRFVAGGVIWNLNDFTSEIKIDAVPFINSKGINTFDRKPKETYFYYKANFYDKPFVKIFSPFGDVLAGFIDEGPNYTSTRRIDVFSNLDSIKLKNNSGDFYYAKVVDGYASFYVPFTQGRNILEAAAFNENGLTLCDNVELEFEIIPRITEEFA